MHMRIVFDFKKKKKDRIIEYYPKILRHPASEDHGQLTLDLHLHEKIRVLSREILELVSAVEAFI